MTVTTQVASASGLIGGMTIDCSAKDVNLGDRAGSDIADIAAEISQSPRCHTRATSHTRAPRVGDAALDTRLRCDESSAA
jgi:hypothetical protein